eukprot:gene15920-18924_t
MSETPTPIASPPDVVSVLPQSEMAKDDDGSGTDDMGSNNDSGGGGGGGSTGHLTSEGVTSDTSVVDSMLATMERKRKKREARLAAAAAADPANGVGLFRKSKSSNPKRRYANRKKCPRLYVTTFADVPEDIIIDLKKEDVDIQDIKANLKIFLTILKFLTRQKITFVCPEEAARQEADAEAKKLIDEGVKDLAITNTTTATTDTPAPKEGKRERAQTRQVEIQTSSVEVTSHDVLEITDENEKRKRMLELKLERKRALTGTTPEFLAEASTTIKNLTEAQIKKKIKFGSLVGKGGYGKVFEAHYEKKKVAIKVVHYKTPKEQHDVLIEVGFLNRCRHPNIIEYRGSVVNGSELYIFTEFMHGGTLEQAVTSPHVFKDSHIGYVAKEILKGIAYLHQNKLVHRDIKSGNIMITLEGEIKLIDFGLCSSVEKGSSYHMVGSPYWMPPEMIRGEHHSYPADIWSFGVCLLEMMFKKPPHRESRLKAMFVNSTLGIDVTKIKCALDLKDLLWQCFEMDPKKRSSANKLLRHPFFARAEERQGMRGLFDNMFLQRNLGTTGLF